MARRPGPLRLAVAAALLLPVLEIVAVVAVAKVVGAGWTLAALVALSIVGVVVLRRAARAAASAFGPAVVVDGVPVRSTGPASKARGADLGLEVAGGVLLAVPGFLTAVAGLLLVVPPTRRLLRPLLGAAAARLVASAVRRGRFHVVGGQVVGQVVGEAVDVTVVEPQQRAVRADEEGPDAGRRGLPGGAG